MVHGGAGPQDPKGESFLLGQKFLSEMLDSIYCQSALVNTAGILPDLCREWPQIHLASRLILEATRKMESEPMLNSGYGASLQSDGVARVSASFMESQHRKFSAVMNTTDLEHPSELAWWLQRERFSVLDSMGAKNLKEQLGCSKKNLITSERHERWIQYKKQKVSGRTSTVGAIAIDAQNNLAVLTSTGGVGNETPGRVGDSPTIAGNYCTRRVAVSCTGFGEQIISHAVSPRLAIAFEQGKTLFQAAEEVFTSAAAQNFSFAAIAVASHFETDEIEWVAISSQCQLLWDLRVISS